MNLTQTASRSWRPSALQTRRCWPWFLWGLSVLLILTTQWLEGRALAAAVLLLFLPGWSWLEGLATGPKEGMWRIVVAAGISFSLTALGTMFAAYLPGPLTIFHILGLSALTTIPPLLLAARRRLLPLTWPDRRLWLLLILVLILAAATRLPHLGYPEWHEDEAEVASLAMRTIKGEDYSIFLHRKGPVQMLVPTASWLLTDRIQEGWTRLSFALASLLGVLTITLLAYRVGGLPAGAAAGALLALNGYDLVFGRMLQFQALITFLSAMSIACLWLAQETGKRDLIWPAMMGMTVSLLAHYDTLLLTPLLLYMGIRIWLARPALRSTLLLAAAVAVGLLASFYVPYLLDPQFEHTRSYLFGNRVGTRGLYNNQHVIHNSMIDYSTRFYQAALWVLTGVLVLFYHPRSKGWLLALVLGLAGAASTWFWPEIWLVGSLDLSILPWLLFLLAGGVGLARRKPDLAPSEAGRAVAAEPDKPRYETLWLWWAAPFLIYGFVVRDPRAHVYIMYPGWVMVGGLAAAALWYKAAIIRPLLVAAGAILAALILVYQGLVFQSTESQYLDRLTVWKDSIGDQIYGSLPKPRAVIGYPKRVGWKAVGTMMANGQLPTDFRSVDEDFSVAMWYTFEIPRPCYNDPLLYMINLPLDDPENIPEGPLQEYYGQTGTVYSEGLPRIGLFLKGQPSQSNVIELDALAREFDRIATPGRFISGTQAMQPVGYRFGDFVTLTGYGLSTASRSEPGQPIKAGDTVFVGLEWHPEQETDIDYRAFIHLGKDPVQAQQDDDPICRLPTSLWRGGHAGVGRFRIAIPPETAPGSYPLLLGLYDPGTMERLPVVDGQGNPVGNAVVLDTIQVTGQ